MHTYDLVVLGGGAAAFAAITEADRRNLTTAIVNAGLPLGGTCVNVGCIPSKHLLALAKTGFEPPRTPFDAVQYDAPPTIDWPTVIAEKDRLIEELREERYVDVATHLDADVYDGHGRFVASTTIEVTDGPDAGTQLTGDRALIATGSTPRTPTIPGLDDVAYDTSESILDRPTRPEDVIVIGGGYVGVEWGQILHRMGSRVTILQRSPHLLSRLWPPLGRDLITHLRDDGITVETDTTPTRVTTDTNGHIRVDATTNSETRSFTATDLFLAAGVTPNTHGIGLTEIGIETNPDGTIVVDPTYQTTNPAVYAAGDCIGEPMLETVAAKEGNHATTNAFGTQPSTIDYTTVPTVVFTSPEVASVGITEPAYMAEHGTCSCRTVTMNQVPKAATVMDTRGLVQVVAHHETDRIVGVHMVAPRAADMISEAALAVKHGLTIDDVIDTVHPFPTYSEALKHACQAFRRDTTRMSCCVE